MSSFLVPSVGQAPKTLDPTLQHIIHDHYYLQGKGQTKTAKGISRQLFRHLTHFSTPIGNLWRSE